MKLPKTMLLTASLPCFLLLSSCADLFHIDALVAGHYTGYTEASGTPYLYSLDLKEISKEEFEEAQGVNVVRDVLTDVCYSFHLSRMDTNRVVEEFTYSGFHDLTPKNEDWAIRYGCDQGAWFSPYTTKANNDPRDPDQCGYYFVQPSTEMVDGFSIYLHAKERPLQ